MYVFLILRMDTEYTKASRLLGAVVAARKCRPSGAQPQTTQHLSGGLLISFFKGRIYGP